MPKLTPEQIAKIRQKEQEMPDALKRDVCVDYYHGWFFVTLNTRNEIPVLSWLEGNINLPAGHANAPHCVYSEVGQGVLAAWNRMAKVCDTVEIDLCEAMPEHFHGLVHLLPGNKRHLGSLISGFMSGCSHAYWDTLGIEWRKNRDEKVRAKQEGGKTAYAALPADRDRDHSHSLIGPALFVHGYNDMVPITPEEVEIKRAYIRDQARKRLIQGANHDCFRVFRHQRSRSWTREVALAAVANDGFFSRNGEACREAQRKVLERLDDGLSFVGNRQLLAHEWKLPLVCHRRDSHCFEQQKEAVLRAARKGAVIVSAFISPKEREIMKLLMVEQLPFIEIMDNGFSDRYKPTGKSFYACCESRLTQITCWHYQYQRDSQISRAMCMVMNQLVRMIAKKPDDWWKKL